MVDVEPSFYAGSSCRIDRLNHRISDVRSLGPVVLDGVPAREKPFAEPGARTMSKSHLSRRQFMNRSLAAAGVAGSFAIGGTKSSGRVIGANDTVRIAVAGI